MLSRPIFFIFIINAGFEVLTAVVMKGFIIWNIMTCSPFNSADGFEDYIAPTFGVGKYAKEENSVCHKLHAYRGEGSSRTGC
jgi:hypothetical protein